MGRPRKPIQQLTLPGKFKRSLFNMLGKGPVEVAGFGLFSIVYIPEKTLYHNFSKRMRTLPAYHKVKFTQSKLLKEII